MIKLFKTNPMLKVTGFVQELRDHATAELIRKNKMEEAKVKATTHFETLMEITQKNIDDSKQEASQSQRMADVIEGAYS